MLRLTGITKKYGDVSIFNNLDLEIEAGDMISITGPSGSGKTTLFNMIGSLDCEYDGEIFYNNKAVKPMTEKEKLFFRNNNIGFVFQEGFLLPQCNVIENILLPTIPFADKSVNYYDKATKLLARVGMRDRANAIPAKLSGGERQRVTLVRALIKSPQVIIADEPTGSLDSDNAENLGNLLKEINKFEKSTMIVFTHSEKLAAMMNKKYKIIGKKIIGI